MATGDQADIFARIKATLPPWFGDNTPNIDAIITGFAELGAFLYQLYSYAKIQTRILTATDGWLDMVSADFFGSALPRKANQSDASFRANIIANLFRERGTRNAIIKVLVALTGRTPIIYEPMRPMDCGGYGIAYGYSAGIGAYGSILIGPYQGFITAFRPLGTGIPNIAGYGISFAGYGVPSQGKYADISEIQNAISDADIYAAIDSVKPAATIPWTRIQN